ncbi:MAG: hypothetical protein ILP19_00605 [Oscillospiraceae bacterium]|nr:hypothetical protein [Oscillospiraceae bacterium]
MLLVDIDKNELEREYEKYKKSAKIHPAIFIIGVIGGVILLGISESLLFTFIVLLIYMLIYGIIKNRKNNKLYSFRVYKASRLLIHDPVSEVSREKLFIMSNGSKKFTDKVMTDIILSDLYIFRDDIASAINTLNSTDRTKLSFYPEAALALYHEMILSYYCAGDMKSVLNVYTDAQPYLEGQMRKDFMSMYQVLDAMIYVNSAAGNNSKALDLMLTKNRYFEYMSKKNMRSALNRLNNELVHIETAELYLKCGDSEKAREWLSAALPVSQISAHNIRRAEELRQQLGDKPVS